LDKHPHSSTCGGCGSAGDFLTLHSDRN
jgi:hypothetical protein